MRVPQLNTHEQTVDMSWEIGRRLRKYGRMPVRDMKEKYGTWRVYCSFGWYSLHDFLYPGHAFIRYPKFLANILYSRIGYEIDTYIFRIINLVIIPYHKWLYRKVYLHLLRKYPECADSIIHGMDYPELLPKEFHE